MSSQPTEKHASSSVENSECHDVRVFSQKFGFITADTPGHLAKHKLKERCECMMEELKEFADACGLEYGYDEASSSYKFSPMDPDQNLAAQADALVDLVYFALGTAVMLGLPWQQLWDDVHRANMSKVRGIKPTRGHAADVVKPDGWVGPRTEEILAEAGYKREDWVGSFVNQQLGGISEELRTGVIDDEVCRDDY